MSRGREIRSNQRPELRDWLNRALVGVAIRPDAASPERWHVAVHNGQPEPEREEAVVATCPSEYEAALVGLALWKLAESEDPR